MLSGAYLEKWTLVYTKRAQKDAKKLAKSGLKPQALDLLNILTLNPFQSPPRYEKLRGDLSGAYARRINIQHRLVYQVFDERRIVKIVRMWTHYE
jgi:toxin YoeB